MRVLIADDDSNSAKVISLYLARYGECTVVTDGLQAVSAVMDAYRMNSIYDLLVLDVMMPNLDGTQALDAIRDYEASLGIPEEKRLRVIIISALSSDSIRAEVYSKGCLLYMRKPVNFEVLQRILQDEHLI